MGTGCRKPLGVEDLNRATLKGFEVYMGNNPVYFQDLSGMAPSNGNVRAFWTSMRGAGLIAAHAVSKHCRCRFCRNGKAPSRGRIEEDL